MLYTGYFSRIGYYLNEIPSTSIVGIAAKLPDDTPYPIVHMKELAPTWSIFSEYKSSNDKDRYTIRFYKEVLDKLNPFSILKQLTDLGDSSVLLCYEKPGSFCHRHLVANWLSKNCGVACEEFK